MIKKLKEILKKIKSKIINFLKSIKMPLFVFLFSFFGAFAGSQGTSKNWRRILLPVISTVYAYIKMSFIIGWQALWMTLLMARAGCYSMGYGIPDDNWPQNPNADEGSDIGRFWTVFWRKKLNDIKKAHRYADYTTRGTIALMHSTVLLVIPILTGNWVIYLLGCLGIILSNSLISWRAWGEFKPKWNGKPIMVNGKELELLWSDIVHYAIDGFCTFAIITWKII
jgi:hypothetical protein